MHQHDNWIEHHGLVKPTLIMPEGSTIIAKLRDGTCIERINYNSLSWIHEGKDGDLVAYRIQLRNPPPVQEGEIVLSAADVKATREWAKMFLAATDPAGADALTVDDYRQVLADSQRLTKELDVLLNGKGAAAQASLCDIVGQVKGIVGEGTKPLLARLPVMERMGRIKMSGLESEGWSIAGYAIQKGDRFGMVTGGGRVLWWDDSMGETPADESDWVMSGPEALAALMWPSYPTELGHMHQALISANGQQVYVMAFGGCAMTCIQLVQKVDAVLTGNLPVSVLPALKLTQHPDDVAVDKFAEAMKAKMAASRERGRGGWDDPEQCSVESLASALIDHLIKGDPVDIGNFAMMLHQREAGTGVLGREAYARVDTTTDGEWVKAASDLIRCTPCINDEVFKPADPVATLDGIVRDVRDYTRRIAIEERDYIAAEFGVVRVEISGFTGCGKSAVAGVLERALVAHGLNVDWVGGQQEKNLRPSVDFSDELALHMPLVQILERNVPKPKSEPIVTIDQIPPVDPEFSAEYWADVHDDCEVKPSDAQPFKRWLSDDLDDLAHPKVSLIDVPEPIKDPVALSTITYEGDTYIAMTNWIKNVGAFPVEANEQSLIRLDFRNNDAAPGEYFRYLQASGLVWSRGLDSVNEILSYRIYAKANPLPECPTALHDLQVPDVDPVDRARISESIGRIASTVEAILDSRESGVRCQDMRVQMRTAAMALRKLQPEVVKGVSLLKLRALRSAAETLYGVLNGDIAGVCRILLAGDLEREISNIERALSLPNGWYEMVGSFVAKEIRIPAALDDLVTPEPEEGNWVQDLLPVKVRVEDISISTYRSKQQSAWTYSAEDGVLVRHKPSGAEFSSHEGRSAHQNRHFAMTMLRDHLLSELGVGIDSEGGSHD